MKVKLLEETLKKDERFKNLKKRNTILNKRMRVAAKNQKVVLLRMNSLGRQALTHSNIFQEINNLFHDDLELIRALYFDQYNSLMEENSIDEFTVRNDSLMMKWEEMMDQYEARETRIKELLDSLVES